MAHDPNNIATWPLHQQAEALWQREGGHCVSSLVHTLAKSVDDASGELSDLAWQAYELSTPIDDWESAAREAGWRPTEVPQDDGTKFYLSYDFASHETAQTWRELCEAEDIDPHQREVYEHWIVSDWLADQLAERGEKVDKDFAGLVIWARTTTGQAVYADHVIEQIAAATYGREG